MNLKILSCIVGLMIVGVMGVYAHDREPEDSPFTLSPHRHIVDIEDAGENHDHWYYYKKRVAIIDPATGGNSGSEWTYLKEKWGLFKAIDKWYYLHSPGWLRRNMNIFNYGEYGLLYEWYEVVDGPYVTSREAYLRYCRNNGINPD